MKICYSAKESDNLGAHASCLVNRLNPTWTRTGGRLLWLFNRHLLPVSPVWSPAWHRSRSIMLPNGDMAALTQYVLLARSPWKISSATSQTRGLFGEVNEEVRADHVAEKATTRVFFEDQIETEKMWVCFEDDFRWNVRQLRLLWKMGLQRVTAKRLGCEGAA